MPQPGSGGSRHGNWPPGQQGAPRHPEDFRHAEEQWQAEADESWPQPPQPQYPQQAQQSRQGRGPVPGPPGQPQQRQQYGTGPHRAGPQGPGPQAPSGPHPAQPRFTPNEGYAPQYAAQAFRNPRTGSDYHQGDNYTMPASQPSAWTTGRPEGNAISPVSGYQIAEADAPYMQEADPGGDGAGSGGKAPRQGRRFFRRKRGRIRRILRLKTVRAILAALAIFLCITGYSVGKAIFVNNGQSVSSNLAEWARDHYLGPLVTFGEWLTYQPPKVGGRPDFQLTGPGGKTVIKHKKGFKPFLPAALASPNPNPNPGEGQWQLVESVKGQPAMYLTYLTVDSVHTSYVASIVAFDQRLVKFQLHPGTTDPGQGFGGARSYVPPGGRTGLLATLNGGFRLSASGGGFYLNGSTWGTLTKGAASVVYYKNGTVNIGTWGTDVSMSPDVAGVRQNLKLIVINGQVPASVNSNVETSWGATLGGAYDVWRSGIGITKDGRVVFVYGPALSVHSLADLLRRAGAVRGMQLDINPFWMSCEYYLAAGHPGDPTPVMCHHDQQQTAYRYYSPYSRDFMTVFAR
ncbi:MAG TPA: phosphodiester glycosidase family protein [Streptosporangiaceae bacterium]|nr:phosphodiester glycosidase family protein [Streptosporangiaceae bacterium]